MPEENKEAIAPVPQKDVDPTGVKYAGFWSRLAANFLDGIILWVISFALSFVFQMVINLSGADSAIASVLTLVNSLVQMVISFGYAIYFIGSRGQTPGKMALKIKVVKVGTDSAPGYFSAFLRDVVGKLISSLVLGLGYLWMLWDPKKQTWHDKIAGTVVVKTS